VGVKKTSGHIRKNFTFPRLKSIVANYVASCINCSSRRYVSKHDKVPIKQFDRPLQTFSQISIDIFGPLDKSSKGYQYVLGVVDLASNFAEMYPLKTLKSSEVIEQLLKWVCLTGIPHTISMDNARNLNSELCEAIYKFFSVEMRNSQNYHREGNLVSGLIDPGLVSVKIVDKEGSGCKPHQGVHISECLKAMVNCQVFELTSMKCLTKVQDIEYQKAVLKEYYTHMKSNFSIQICEYDVWLVDCVLHLIDITRVKERKGIG